jgi:endo-1,4-beta-xylanase
VSCIACSPELSGQDDPHSNQNTTEVGAMRRAMTRTHRESWVLIILLGALFVSGCASDDGTSTGAIAPGGGTGATGGFAGSPLAGASGGNPAGGTSGSAGAAGRAGAASVAGSGGTAGSGAGGMAGGGQGAAGASGAAGVGGTGGMGGIGGTGGTGGTSGAGGNGGTGGGGDTPPAKFCGNITTAGAVRSDFIEYWDQITPENEGKWGSVEGTRDQMNWGGLDAAYEYAMEHDIPFKQHTFVWGAQQPGWIGGLSEAEQREEVEEWIRLFCERYPETQMIDVVNEPPPHTTPAYVDALGGAGASGYDWIVQAFEWADQYCPNAILILNDYNTIEYGNDNSHFIDIVKAIQAAGAPIDAVGAQAHAAFNVPTNTVEMFLDRLASETGLPVYISEYDIDLADDNQQRQVMESQFTMFWNHEDVAGVTLWGYVQGQTWLSNSGLMSSGGQQRPAMTWLMDFLGR